MGITIPLDEPIVATAVLLLIHVPPVTLSVSVVVPGKHMLGIPLITAIGLTDTIIVDLQPDASE